MVKTSNGECEDSSTGAAAESLVSRAAVVKIERGNIAEIRIETSG
jgi:hypothetical protein